MARDPFNTYRPSDGGRLITVFSAENVGANNYTSKVNFYRVDDCEVRRQGTEAFGAVASEALIGLWEAVLPAGTIEYVAAGPTKIFKYAAGVWTQIGSGFLATSWEGESLDGYLILNSDGGDLPVWYRPGNVSVTPLYELREVGIASAGTMAVFNGFLKFANIREIPAADLSTVLNGGNPYGRYNGTVNHVRYKIIWSDYGNPTNWAPVITGTINTANKDRIVLQWPSQAFKVGDKLAVIGAAAGGGTLGGQTNIPDGVPVTAVSGNQVTISVPADSGLTYPLTVQVTRFADTSSFAGSSSIQDDSSTIVRMVPLKSRIVVYRSTGIWVGVYSASVDSPFIYTPAYYGPNILAFPKAIASVEGDYHVFAGTNAFYRYDGAGNPEIHRVFDDARNLFFDGASLTSFAAVNATTREVWFCNSQGVLAFDYQFNTLSWIDEDYTAVLSARVGADNTVYQHLMARGTACYKQSSTTFTRASGRPNVPSLTYGFAGWGSDASSKELRGYLPLIASDSPNVAINVTMRGRDNSADTAEVLFTETLANPAVTPEIEAYFRNVYFQDTITLADARDLNFKWAGRGYRIVGVDTRGVTRNYNGHS